MEFSDGRLLIFAKTPVPGHAKTRLTPALGPAGAAALHERMCHAAISGQDGQKVSPWRLRAAMSVQGHAINGIGPGGHGCC